MESRRLTVLMLGDGCVLTTGFSQVLNQWSRELVSRGHDVHQIASLDIGPNHDSQPYRDRGVTPWYPSRFDYVGFTIFADVFKQVQPDVIVINADPGTIANWYERIMSVRGDVPIVIYAPIEGAPVNETFAEVFRKADVVYTYTQWSSDVLKAEYGLDIPFVYHGVSTEFVSLDAGLRRAVRRRLGWEGKYVVMYVARNAGRKAQDVLVKAMAELKAHDVDDVLLYLHCKSFDRNQLQGWDLAFLSHWCGVTDMVEFADVQDAARGESRVSLVQKYGAADLYVHPAQVEGFGLPILEAMSAGLPTVITKDEGNMQEIGGDGTLATVAPVLEGTWFTGAQLCLTAPEQWAQVIAWAKAHPKEAKVAGERGQQRARLFPWSTMRRVLADAVERAVPEQQCAYAQ